MVAPNQSPPNQTNTPKSDTLPPVEALPPPYSASRRPSLAPGIVRLGYSAAQARSRVFIRPIAATMAEEQEDGETSNTLSSLHFRINTSINISKNNNIVCLSDSPATNANAIAEAVSQSLQKHSSGNCGIPMIDGDGNPRPIKVEVDAGMVVDGVSNVVGTEKIIDDLLKQRAEMHMQTHLRARENPTRADTDSEPPCKRRRSE